MYCLNCGNKIKKPDKYCSNCGEKLSLSTNQKKSSNPKINNNGTVSLILGLVSFIFLSYPPIAIIFAIISIILGKKYKKETGNNTAGPILGIITLILSIIEIIATIILMLFFNEYTENNYSEIIFDNYYDNYFEYNEDYYNKYEDNTKESFDISGYSWLGTDNSMLYLNHNPNYTWYQDDKNHSNNFHSGFYEFYTGEEAINYISTKLPEYGITEDIQRNMIETKNYELKDYYLLILNCNKSIINNEEQTMANTKIYYYGFYNKDINQLDLINMATKTSAQFKLKDKLAKIDI